MSRTKTLVGLRRGIGLLGSFSFGYADVGAGIYLTLGLVAQFSGPATPFSFAVASFVYLFTALVYAELASTLPEAGGGLIYSLHAFGRLPAFITGWALLLDYVVTTSIFALATVGYLGYLVPVLHSDPFFSLSALVLVLVLIFLNIAGIKESARFSSILVVLDIVGIAVVLIIGYLFAFKPFFSQIQWGTTPTSDGFLFGTSIAMASFLGIEVISQTAEETKTAARTIPRAVFMISTAVVIISIGFSALAISVVPWNVLAGSFKDPAAVVASHLPGGSLLSVWLAVMGLTVCAVATNAGVVGASRMSYSMSRVGLLPKWLGQVNRRTGAPQRAIIIFAAIQLVIAYLGNMGLAADLYNFGALLSYMLVNLALIRLRNKEPAQFRPFKLRGTISITRGMKRFELPVIALLGFLSTAFIWLLVVWTHEIGRIVGFAWLGIGLLLYLLTQVLKRPASGK